MLFLLSLLLLSLYYSGGMGVSPSIRGPVTKFALMYREQMAGTRNADFGTRMHVKKIRSMFIQIVKVNDSNQVHWEVRT